MKKLTRLHALLILLALAALLVPFRAPIRELTAPLFGRARIADRVRQYGPAARARLAPDFAKAGIAYPPEQVTILALKRERILQLYAGPVNAQRFIRAYPIFGASGELGPKLREGDFQVPEGVYAIGGLNANSSYHLSLLITFPNALDRRMARQERRGSLGGDIYIHGGSASIGCIAIDDEPIEDLFILAADTGTNRLKVVISPVDFRVEPNPPDLPTQPAWVPGLYDTIRGELGQLPPANGA